MRRRPLILKDEDAGSLGKKISNYPPFLLSTLHSFPFASFVHLASIQPAAPTHPLSRSHLGKLVLVSELEPIAQRSHIWILIALEFVALRNGTHSQANNLSCPAGLETEPKIAGMLLVDAEGICRPIRIGIDISGKPLLCETWSALGLVLAPGPEMGLQFFAATG